MARTDGAVIINADDFGISTEVNRRIVECFRAGRITSATLMANGPAFDDACMLIRRHDLHGRVGIHLNLTAFAPLGRGARALWGDALAFPEERLSIPRAWAPAIREELDLQIRRLREAGIHPTHADSHHHVLNGLPYLRIAVPVLRSHGIRKLRPARNRFYERTALLYAMKTCYNGAVRLAGFRAPRSFTDVKPLLDHLLAGEDPPAAPIEAMCHPGAPLAHRWLEAEDEADALLGDAAGRAIEPLKLIGYAEL